jgi:hypothetical protein
VADMMLNQQRARSRVVPRRFGPISSPGSSPTSIIPYDHAAKFELKGVPGNIVQDVINIGAEGVFVAVAIGYGFQEERGQFIEIPITPLEKSGDITLGRIPVEALITGFRLDPRLGPAVFPDQELPRDFGNKLFQRVKAAEEISFLFSIVDSGTGRELQDEPTHNIASLGTSNGERPFRLLAQPLTFLPRSTIRLQIIERSEGIKGTLFIVLYGYKILGASSCPEPLMRSLRGSPACPTETIGSPRDRTIPFDYVARVELTGQPKNRVEAEVPINVEGGFVATTLGYGLAVEEREVLVQSGGPVGSLTVTVPSSSLTLKLLNLDTRQEIALSSGTSSINVDPGEYVVVANSHRSSSKIRVVSNLTTTAEVTVPPSGVPEVASATINLSTLPLRLLPPETLIAGFRIRPNFLRISFQGNGNLTATLPANLLDQIFEPLNRPEDVSFRYTIFDSGRGVELQNQPIHNIAGLGIANGDRPFKRFARPMIFLPRSTIRITIEEHFGRGTLFLVFQGYKVLGAIAGIRGRP